MIALILFVLTPSTSLAQQTPKGLAMPETSRVHDRMTFAEPSQVEILGLLGKRYFVSENNRLLTINEDELLSGFQHPPGSHEWIGEHVGKWLYAASLTYACSGDNKLKTKLDRVASELMKTQGSDGYMGTYIPSKRMGYYDSAHWDVWVHKYDLIGLLAYYQYTGNKDALLACRRIGDLLINTFGADKKNIDAAGTHKGLASTSVLEPMVLLYRATGDKRYLDFAEYIVESWDQPNGPHLLTALLKGEPVYKIGDAKAYEMTSDLVGLCEIYRATGKTRYLTAVLNAWKDIASNRLYITGSGSSYETWHPDYVLPGDQKSDICETCVTVTWIQLNAELLRLRGESRFAEEIEKTIYNHLLAAQKPTGDDWCYYTPMEGHKKPDSETTCCHSSGPRGISLMPVLIYSTTSGGITVNLFTASHAVIPISSRGSVELEQKTNYPFDGDVVFVVTPTNAHRPFTIRLRRPVWCADVALSVNGTGLSTDDSGSGYISIRRKWKAGDTIAYHMNMTPRIIIGDHDNAGRMAMMYGPMVLAADHSHNQGLFSGLKDITIMSGDNAAFTLRRKTASDIEPPVFTADGLSLVPFYAAGYDGSEFAVWMRRPSILRQ